MNEPTIVEVPVNSGQAASLNVVSHRTNMMDWLRNFCATLTGAFVMCFAMIGVASTVLILTLSGIGGITMMVLGAICIDTVNTIRAPQYCDNISHSGNIALIVIGCILICCCCVRSEVSNRQLQRT